jgi:hypothetical protein
VARGSESDADSHGSSSSFSDRSPPPPPPAPLCTPLRPSAPPLCPSRPRSKRPELASISRRGREIADWRASDRVVRHPLIRVVAFDRSRNEIPVPRSPSALLVASKINAPGENVDSVGAPPRPDDSAPSITPRSDRARLSPSSLPILSPHPLSPSSLPILHRPNHTRARTHTHRHRPTAIHPSIHPSIHPPTLLLPEFSSLPSDAVRPLFFRGGPCARCAGMIVYSEPEDSRATGSAVRGRPPRATGSMASRSRMPWTEPI